MIVDQSNQQDQDQQAHMKVVVPGDYIGQGYVAGNGTYVPEDEPGMIYASMAGVVHLIDRVICVRPTKSHYRPDIGDVIVGRVVSVDQSRWQVDVNSYQHAILNLSAINLPGGVQRRRVQEDQLHIRDYYIEGDLISAEVQQIGTFDGKIQLHTRTQKYGKLKNGMLMKVDNNLIRRMKSHVHEFFHQPTIGCILGTNGYIWIYSQNQEDDQGCTSPVERKLMAILRNSILVLQKARVPIFKDTILKVLDMQAETEIEPRDMVQNYEVLAQTAQAMIEVEISQRKPIDFQALMEQIEQGDFVEVQ